MARAGDVAVRELIYDHDFGLARDDRVEVHFLERYAAVRNIPARNYLEVADTRFGLAPMMGFDKTQHDVHSPLAELMRLFEHPISFAYPRGGAEVDFEPPFLSLGNEIEESFVLDSLLL